MGLSVLDYLRWFRASLRRIPEEVRTYRYRRDWWRRGVLIAPTAIIRLSSRACLEIGRGSSVGPYTLLALGDDALVPNPVESVLRIGENTSIGEFNNIRAAYGEIEIGSHCLISQFVSILAVNHSLQRGQYIRDQPMDLSKNSVHIGDDVWIGANVVVLPGAVIGTGAVIGAGAVVASHIPQYAIAVGVPARVIRFRPE